MTTSRGSFPFCQQNPTNLFDHIFYIVLLAVVVFIFIYFKASYSIKYYQVQNNSTVTSQALKVSFNSLRYFGRRDTKDERVNLD